MSAQPRRILVVANETLGGRRLIEAVERRVKEAQAAGTPVKVTVICPQNQPRHGYVIHDETIQTAAENRLATTLAHLREAGIEAEGEVMDPDPYSATMDAVDHFGADEIVISTHPETRSGWMRRDLIDRIQDATDLPVEHVVVDLDEDRAEATRTLVVANQTVEGTSLINRLKEKAAEGPHRFIVVCPHGDESEEQAQARLDQVLAKLGEAGLEAMGQVMHPDPFTAIQNALQFYAVDEIVISTLPDERSGWMRGNLIERVQASTSKPVEHVVVSPEELTAEAAG
jgi:hypothetical protein